MSRIRSLKPEWLEDEALTAASDAARTLSAGLLLLADDYGNGRGSVPFLTSRVWPAGNGCHEKTTVALQELVKIRFVQTYTVDGQTYFSIRNWKKHQRVDKPGKPQVPFPPESSSPEASANIRETLEKVPETPGVGGESLAPRARPLPLPDPIPGPGPDPGQARDPEERETVVPLDLLERTERAGIPEQFAKAYGVDLEAVRGEIRETVAYWSIGAGAGKRKRNWLLVVRSRLHERAKEGRLGAPPPRARADSDWPTDDACRLREAIRSGQHGKGLAAKLDAGQLDYPLAQRLVRERQEAARRVREGALGGTPTEALSTLLSGIGRAMR